MTPDSHQSESFDRPPSPLVPVKWERPRPAGLIRERLNRMAPDLWEPALLLVSGSAGTGKTTLLSQLCDAAGAPVAWYTADTTERSEEAFLSYVAAALDAALPGCCRAAASADAVAAALHAAGSRVLLVLEDLHNLEGSPAEAALARLVRLRPPNLAIAVSSRSTPDLNLSRLRLNKELVEIGARDLRFRVWEVERLFREEYGQPLAPGELAELTRRTNGWAAGLHLFHLATRDLPGPDRRKRLGTLSGSSRWVREYLADNVVRDLPSPLRRFMVETSILRTLSPSICDSYLGSGDSSRWLHEMERRNLLLFASSGECRLNEVLRSHLEDCLVREVGDGPVRERYRRAAVAHEEAGQPVEALQGFVRARDEQGVARMLTSNGPVLAVEPLRWIEVLPAALVAQDAWLVLAMARRHRDAGCWKQALDLYQTAERIAVTDTMAELCASERRGLAMWLDRPLGAQPGWNGRLRMATVCPEVEDADPAAPDAMERFVSGMLHLLAGNVSRAERILESTYEMDTVTPVLAVGAGLGAALAAMLQGKSAQDIETLVARADELGFESMAWLGRAALALVDGGDGMQAAYRASDHFKAVGDPWGEALSGLLIGLGAQSRSDFAPVHLATLSTAGGIFRNLGASALHAWCCCVESALAGGMENPLLRESALAAEAAALSSRLTGPLALVYDALAVAEPDRSERHRGIANHIRQDTGWAAGREPLPARTPSVTSVVSLSCFGEFRLKLGARVADLSSIKPRARQLLRLLAINFPQGLHREVIGSALWPDAPEESVRRSLQVAVSSVRKLFQELRGAEAGCGLVREGESYRLKLPRDADIDLERFSRLQRQGKLAEAQGRHAESRAAFAAALDLYKGDLLAEDGPAEWVIGERERCRSQAVGMAQALASSFLAAGRPAEAAAVCERAVRIDRYTDALWRSLIKAHGQAQNRAAAARARGEYVKVLSELGLAEPAAM